MQTDQTVERFGKFVILRPIGQGGMGAISLAYDLEAKAFVAIKRVLEDEPGLLARFQDEQRLAVKLRHTHLVPVREAGSLNDKLYLAMDWVPGRNLEQIEERARQNGSIKPEICVLLMRQVCSALTYVHELSGLNFVHRDIAPSNIVLGYDGKVRLIDYGLAWTTLKRTQTQPLAFIGNHIFSAPEQWEGRPASVQSDLYAVGAVLWHLLSRRLPREPWKEQSDLPARLSTFMNIDSRLDDLVAQLLSPKPEDRPKSAADVGKEFDRYLAVAPTPNLAKWIDDIFPGEKEAWEQEKSIFVQRLSAQTAAAQNTESKKRPIYLAPLLIGLALLPVVFFVGYQMGKDRTSQTPEKALPPNSVTMAAPRIPEPPLTLPTTESTKIKPDSPQRPVVSDSSDRTALKKRYEELRNRVRKGQMNLVLRSEFPQNPQALPYIDALKGEIAYQNGHYEEAARFASKAVEAGGFAEAFILRGYSHLNLGKSKEAERDFLKALHLSPKSVEAREGLEHSKGQK